MPKQEKFVAGHLREKKGKYYTVISYYIQGKRTEKWEKTGILAVPGNKKKAEAILLERRINFVIPGSDIRLVFATAKEAANMLFADFLEQWIEVKEPQIAPSTYDSYGSVIDSTVAPYFKEKEIKLCELMPKHFMDFYSQMYRIGKSSGTVRNYHAVMHAALNYAVMMDIIVRNPLDKVEKPKIQKHIYTTLNDEELKEVIRLVRGNPLEIPVLLAAFYGMRRGEACGMRWDRIDFKYNTITVNHVMTMPKDKNGKRHPTPKNLPKNDPSIRTLPLTDSLKERLLAIKSKQEGFKKKFGNSYNTDWGGYVCVRPDGSLITPDYVTKEFPDFLTKHNLTRICFHNVRHSCATLMQKERVGIDYISKFLGHSDISTTANIYCHIDMEMLEKPANKMAEIIELKNDSYPNYT